MAVWGCKPLKGPLPTPSSLPSVTFEFSLNGIAGVVLSVWAGPAFTRPWLGRQFHPSFLVVCSVAPGGLIYNSW